MQFTTTAPASTIRALEAVSTIRDIVTVGNLTTFTCAPHDAPSLLRTIAEYGKVFAGKPKEFGTAPLPRMIPGTTATIRR